MPCATCIKDSWGCLSHAPHRGPGIDRKIVPRAFAYFSVSLQRSRATRSTTNINEIERQRALFNLTSRALPQAPELQSCPNINGVAAPRSQNLPCKPSTHVPRGTFRLWRFGGLFSPSKRGLILQSASGSCGAR
jgi:hypothetical protein